MTSKKNKIYSFWISHQKTFKNIVITWGPAVVAMGISLQASVPAKHTYWIGAGVGYTSYFVKNTIENNGFGWIKTKLGIK